MEVEIPCGRCIGCRLERSRQWAMRCVLESKSWETNCFVTLTYSKAERSLNKEDFVLFMKRLRKAYGNGIRFFHCGEYGEKTERPHHHACLFNLDFEDKKLWSIKGGNKLHTSEKLNSIWSHGYCVIGEVNFESAAYVARYIMKKITGDQAEEHYQGRLPEYITMSRRPGIGKAWYDQFKQDVISKDAIVLREGMILRPPRYYDNILEKLDIKKMEEIKKQRKQKINKKDNSPERLAVKERNKKRQLSQLKRSIENA